MHYKFVCDCMYFICYFEQNGCGKKNTGKLFLTFEKKEKSERLTKVNIQTLSHVSNPLPCKSFYWRQVTLLVCGRVIYVTKGLQD